MFLQRIDKDFITNYHFKWHKTLQQVSGFYITLLDDYAIYGLVPHFEYKANYMFTFPIQDKEHN